MEEVNLHDTFDARVWVQEWMKAIEKNPSIPTDEGTMLAWFANAIMAGHDYLYRGMAEERDLIELELIEGIDS